LTVFKNLGAGTSPLAAVAAAAEVEVGHGVEVVVVVDDVVVDEEAVRQVKPGNVRSSFSHTRSRLSTSSLKTFPDSSRSEILSKWCPAFREMATTLFSSSFCASSSSQKNENTD